MNYVFKPPDLHPTILSATGDFLLLFLVPICVAFVYLLVNRIIDSKIIKAILSYIFVNFTFSLFYIILYLMKPSETKTLISSGYAIASVLTIQGLLDLLIFVGGLSMNIWAHVVYVVIIIGGCIWYLKKD